MGRGIDSRNRVWNWLAKLHRLAGQYDNPVSTWFLVPIARLKISTPTGRYDNPISTRFLASIDCLKIPAQNSYLFSVYVLLLNTVIPWLRPCISYCNSARPNTAIYHVTPPQYCTLLIPCLSCRVPYWSLFCLCPSVYLSAYSLVSCPYTRSLCLIPCRRHISSFNSQLSSVAAETLHFSVSQY